MRGLREPLRLKYPIFAWIAPIFSKLASLLHQALIPAKSSFLVKIQWKHWFVDITGCMRNLIVDCIFLIYFLSLYPFLQVVPYTMNMYQQLQSASQKTSGFSSPSASSSSSSSGQSSSLNDAGASHEYVGPDASPAKKRAKPRKAQWWKQWKERFSEWLDVGCVIELSFDGTNICWNSCFYSENSHRK